MDPLNPALQQRVWSRVMAAPCCSCPPKQTPCQSVPEPCPPAEDVPTPLPLAVQAPNCGHKNCGCQSNWLPLVLILLLLYR